MNDEKCHDWWYEWWYEWWYYISSSSLGVAVELSISSNSFSHQIYGPIWAPVSFSWCNKTSHGLPQLRIHGKLLSLEGTWRVQHCFLFGPCLGWYTLTRQWFGSWDGLWLAYHMILVWNVLDNLGTIIINQHWTLLNCSKPQFPWVFTWPKWNLGLILLESRDNTACQLWKFRMRVLDIVTLATQMGLKFTSVWSLPICIRHVCWAKPCKTHGFPAGFHMWERWCTLSLRPTIGTCVSRSICWRYLLPSGTKASSATRNSGISKKEG